jgi:hypothetical protein
VADEILKLSTLFENKLISAEEFQTLKQKIIGNQLIIEKYYYILVL